MKHYGQLKQDIIIYNSFFKEKKDGFYVDIGAHDGITGSNTYLYDQLGWSGICVEPNKNRYDDLEKNRTSKNYNCVVSNIDKEYVDFCLMDGYAEMLSGIVEKYTENHKKRILRDCEEHKCKREKVSIRNYKFNDLIENKNIDFLSVDTEGGELDILESIDHDQYNINIICFENNNQFDISKSILSKWYELVAYIQNLDVIIKRK
jgi:FkbM family methyltransferase